jgi:Ca2+-binding EF-hand superfamily protein
MLNSQYDYDFVRSLWHEMTFDNNIFTNTILEAFCNSDSLKKHLEILPKNTLEDYKFRSILNDIAKYLKASHLTVEQLFRKLDIDGDGLISHSDYNISIDKIVTLHPTTKEQFFYTLCDQGFIDLKSLIQYFSEIDKKLTQNKYDIENCILKEFKKWVLNNTKLTESEMFIGIDYNGDGRIDITDLKKFLIDVVYCPKADLSYDTVERVIKFLSINKNNFLTLSDFNEVVKDIKANNIKPIGNIIEFKTSSFDLKRSEEWINLTLEKLGSFISEHYDNMEQYFKENSEFNKINLKSFQNWVNRNLAFNDGVSLNSDEIAILFNTLDYGGKNYITLGNLDTRLGSFDFYKKMHLEITKFVKDNFIDGVAAFKYFKDNEINHEEYFLSNRELFDSLNDLLTGKYKTNTILRYINKYFSDPDCVSFSEFNKVYYGLEQPEEYFASASHKINRIYNSRSKEIEKPFFNKNNNRADRAFSARHATSMLNKLSTPFDEDPLEKIKRLINSSKLDFSQYFKLYEMVNGETINQMEFRNMLKHLNIGLTSLEIDYILSRLIKTGNGKVYFKEFFKYINNQ